MNNIVMNLDIATWTILPYADPNGDGQDGINYAVDSFRYFFGDEGSIAISAKRDMTFGITAAIATVTFSEDMMGAENFPAMLKKFELRMHTTPNEDQWESIKAYVPVKAHLATTYANIYAYWDEHFETMRRWRAKQNG